MAQKKKGIGRKYGRNAAWCAAYRNRGQREVNKARRLFKHTKNRPTDVSAWRAWEALPEKAKRLALRD